MKTHQYRLKLRWDGNGSAGTTTYSSYTRNHEIAFEGKPVMQLSSDPYFRGDGSRLNPEELLVSALSSCHMLSYLHLCAVNQIVITQYDDEATGNMVEDGDGGAHFTEVMLRPRVTISSGDPETARHLHEKASELCFIARSVNFPVRHEPAIVPAR